MKSSTKLLLSVLLFSLLSGCFPYAGEMFKPEARFGRLHETSCRYANGPGVWDMLEFIHDDIRVVIQAKNDVDPIAFVLDTSLYIPEGRTVKLTSPKAMLYLKSTEKVIEIETNRIAWYPPRSSNNRSRHEEDADFVMAGQGELRPWTAGMAPQTTAEFHFKFRYPSSLKEDIEIIMPKLIINGRESTLPPLLFNHKNIIKLAQLC